MSISLKPLWKVNSWLTNSTNVSITLGDSISSSIIITTPPAFTVVDGTAISGSAFYQHIDNDENYVLPDGYVFGSKTITLTREGEEGEGVAVVDPSAIVSYDDLLTASVAVTATHATKDDFTYTLRFDGTGINVAPVATVGNLSVDLIKDGTGLFVSWPDLFEPSVAGRELGDITATLTGAPAGVTVLLGGLSFDPAVLDLQVDTSFTVVGSNTSPTPSGPKTIEVTVASNTVSLTTPPTIAQGYEGGQFLELTNRDAILDLANWPGSNPTDYVIAFSRVDGANFNMVDTSRVLAAGEEYVFNASLWAAGTGPVNGNPRLTASSAPMTVAAWLDIADVNGDGSLWHVEADTVAEGGPPDAMVVRGIDIDGRPINDNITAGDLRGADTALLRTHDALAPAYPANASAGNTMTLYEPAVFGPATGIATRQTDVLRNGVVVETDVGDTRPLVLADDGATISTRTTDTHSTASNSPLVSDSPGVVVTLQGWVIGNETATSIDILAFPTNLAAPVFTISNETANSLTLELQ